MAIASPGVAPKTVVTAEEINVLVHGYLAESFPNAASLFRNEARLDNSPLFISLLPTIVIPPIPSSPHNTNAEAGPSTYRRTFTNGRTPTAVQVSRTAAALAKGKGRAEEDAEGDEGDPSYKIKGGNPTVNGTTLENGAPTRPSRTHTRQNTGTTNSLFRNTGPGDNDAEEERAELASKMMHLNRTRKRDLVKFLQLGLMWQENTCHRALAKQGLHCTSSFNLIGSHACQPQPIPSVLDCLTSFQTDLMREASPGPLSPPKTAADKAMERSRSKRRESGEGRASERDGHGEVKNGKRKQRDGGEEELDSGLDEHEGQRTKGKPNGKQKSMGLGDSGTEESVSKRATSDREASTTPRTRDVGSSIKPSLAGVRKVKRPPGAGDSPKSGLPSRLEREGSTATSGTGKSGKSGGSGGPLITTPKGGYRVPRIMSPPPDADESVSVDEDAVAPSKKRKVSGQSQTDSDGGPGSKRKVSGGSSLAPNGGSGRKNKSGATSGLNKSRKTSPAASGSKASSEFGKASGNDDGTSVAAEVVENPLKPVKKEDGVTHWRVRWHQKGIAWVVWNPVNHNTLVTGGIDASCSIWEFGKPEGQMDVDGADELQQLMGLPLNCKMSAVARNKGTTQVMWDSQGTIVVTGCADGNVRAWDVGGAFYGIHARHNGEVTAVAINSSGSRVITAGEDKVLSIWNIHSGTSRDVESRHSACISDVAFFDDDVFATCSEDSDIVIHSTPKLGQMASLRGHTGMVNMIRFSPVNADGTSVGPVGTRRLLASCSDDKSVRIWDVEDLKSGGDNAKADVKREDGSTSGPSLLRSIKGHTDCVALVEWCPVAQADGRRLLATASWANNLSKTDSDNRNAIQVFDAITGTSLYTLTAHGSKIHKLQFEPTRGRSFASCSDDGKLIIWETSSGKQLKLYETDCSINDLHWRSDGQQLAMVADDGTLRTMHVGDLLNV